MSELPNNFTQEGPSQFERTNAIAKLKDTIKTSVPAEGLNNVRIAAIMDSPELAKAIAASGHDEELLSEALRQYLVTGDIDHQFLLAGQKNQSPHLSGEEDVHGRGIEAINPSKSASVKSALNDIISEGIRRNNLEPAQLLLEVFTQLLQETEGITSESELAAYKRAA